MRFGLFGGAKKQSEGPLADSHGYKGFIDYVIEADQLGYYDAFVVEHHFTGVEQISASLSLLTYLAAKTSKIRLGTGVVVLPWHNPALLAEQVATLDLLSGGRFDFGIGKGYRSNEFAGFCVPQDESHERYAESVAFLRKAWTTEGRFSFEGKYWQFADVVIEPTPAQRPHPPFWVAAGSADSIRRAAQGNFNLLLDQIASFEETAERVALYRKTLTDAGFAYDPRRVGVTRALHIVNTEEERERAYAIRREVLKAIGGLDRGSVKGPGAQPETFADPRLAADASTLIGTPAEIVAKLKRLQAMGVEHVLLMDVIGSRDTLRQFAAEVMPAFAAAETAAQQAIAA